jgi:hypothetical protein
MDSKFFEKAALSCRNIRAQQFGSSWRAHELVLFY